MKKNPYLLPLLAAPLAVAALAGCGSGEKATGTRDDSVSISQDHVYSSRLSGDKPDGKAGAKSRKTLSATGRLAIGSSVPDFTFTTLDGTTRHLEEWRGQMALFMVADTTCPCVKAYDDRMKALADKYAAAGLRVVYFFPSPIESRDRIEKFVQKRGYQWVTARDDDQVIFKELSAKCTTESFLFDKNGKLRYHGRIDDNIYMPEEVKTRDLENAIQAIVDGREVPKTEIPAYGCTILRLKDEAKAKPGGSIKDTQTMPAPPSVPAKAVANTPAKTSA